MADTQVVDEIAPSPTCMESVNRITKLPVVETTIQTASNIYEKVKDYNSVTHWTCETAESAVYKAVEVSKPIVQGLEGPIKKVDGVLCSGLDFVEDKVPAVKMPPSEIIYQIYATTKDYVNNTVTPTVENAYHLVEPTVKSAYEKIEPAVEKAKNVVEPAVEKAKTVVEPLVQPAIEKAQALKQYGAQKFEEFIQQHEQSENLECDECQINANKLETQQPNEN